MPEDYDFEELADRGYDEYKEYMVSLPLWIKEQLKAMPDNTTDYEKYCEAKKLERIQQTNKLIAEGWIKE